MEKINIIFLKKFEIYDISNIPENLSRNFNDMCDEHKIPCELAPYPLNPFESKEGDLITMRIKISPEQVEKFKEIVNNFFNI